MSSLSYLVSLNFSGERFTVIYRLTGSEAEATAKAEDIIIEQTVEFPPELIPDNDIRRYVFGRIESLRRLDSGHYETAISYANEISGFELIQLLNVVFGNIAMKPGIRVERLDLPDSLLQAFKGPRFGREGLRARLNIPTRPLLSSALKPMGLPVEALAEQAYQMALGGVDLIKDDHGLADQIFSPYRERVERCVAAVERANRETGYTSVYVPNVSASPGVIVERALFAKQTGAGAIMVSPELVGFDTMRHLADDDRLDLPILNHPTRQGIFVTSAENGIAPYVQFGQIARLAGSDVVIYPNFIGRFTAFGREVAVAIAQGTYDPFGQIKSIFPAPAGGITLARIPETLEVYGREVVLLVGGGLHQGENSLVENARHLRRLVEQ